MIARQQTTPSVARKRRPKPPRRVPRGTTVVEFAIVAVVLFMVVLASVEFNRGMMGLHSLEEAARGGCRVAVLAGSTVTDVEQEVAQLLAIAGIVDHSVAVNPTALASARRWQPITVTVTAPMNEMSWVPLPRYLANQTLQGTCTLPREGEEE